jgi:uncharacterized damage-inducible protein DinB
MATDTEHLTRFYEGWDRYQDLLVEVVGKLSDEQLALHASPSLRPVWTLAAHIISARAGWFHHVMGEAPNRTDFDAMHDWDVDDQPQRSAAELVHGLRETWEMIAECLARWTPDDLDQQFTTRGGNTFSRQWILWHVIEHDLHHGGELFFTLGMHGLPTPEL